MLMGLTGAAIAWNDELERVFAPALFVLPETTVRHPALDLFALREAAAGAVPGYAVNGLDFTRMQDQPALFFVEARPGGPAPLNDQLALDPTTGRVLAARRSGDLSQGTVNLMPFVYRLHDSLAVGDAGIIILGGVALAWTVDCFVGAALTLPAGHGRWWRRWQRSWQIKLPPRRFRFIFDMHRAAGLWLWIILFVLAWSGVAFNLPQVYRPVMAVFGAAPDRPADPPRDPRILPRLGWRDAHRAAQAAMRAAGVREGFVILSERLMWYDPSTHLYTYRVRSDRDIGRLGNTQLHLDGDSGASSAVEMPTGRRAADTVTTWLGELHTADVFGRPMQMILTVVGLGIAMLSITGVLIWLRKRNAHHVSDPVARRERHRDRRPTSIALDIEQDRPFRAGDAAQ